MNFSLFWRLSNAASRNNIEPVINIILFFKVMMAQVVSLTSYAGSNGLMKIFHWLLCRGSLRIRKKMPKIAITTAVPLPFLIVVESINDIIPRNKTGIITCTVTYTNRNLTISIDERNVKTSIIRDAITKIRTILTSHTLYL